MFDCVRVELWSAQVFRKKKKKKKKKNQRNQRKDSALTRPNENGRRAIETLRSVARRNKNAMRAHLEATSRIWRCHQSRRRKKKNNFFLFRCGGAAQIELANGGAERWKSRIAHCTGDEKRQRKTDSRRRKLTCGFLCSRLRFDKRFGLRNHNNSICFGLIHNKNNSELLSSIFVVLSRFFFLLSVLVQETRQKKKKKKKKKRKKSCSL
jgi:hypothetical protein